MTPIQAVSSYLPNESVIACSRLSKPYNESLKEAAEKAKLQIGNLRLSRYEIIGTPFIAGSCALVYPVKDTIENTTLILKAPRSGKSHLTIEETKFLELFRGKEHVIQIQRAFFVTKHKQFIVMEHSRAPNLYIRMVNLHRKREIIQKNELVSIIQQILLGLNEIKGVIHGDIKPENLLWDPTTATLKLIDFGISQFAHSKERVSVVQSAWYRSPDVVLGQYYNESIDMWSLGCIIYELCMGRVPFQAADKDNRDRENLLLLSKFIPALGMPPFSFLGECSSKALTKHFDFEYGLPNKLKGEILKEIDIFSPIKSNWPHDKQFGDQLVDLLKKMLCYENRIKPEEALKHPLFGNH